MNESQARTLAEILGGSPWHSGGGIWLVRFAPRAGGIVLLSSEMVCWYEHEAALLAGVASVEICF